MKKRNQRLHIRILKNANVDKKIVSLFYKSTLVSILFSVTTRYRKLSSADKKKLRKIIRKVKELGAEVINMETLYQEAALKQMKNVIQGQIHTLNNCFMFF